MKKKEIIFSFFISYYQVMRITFGVLKFGRIEYGDIIFKEGLTHKFWKNLYFDAVNDKLCCFIIKAPRIHGNSCKSMGTSIEKNR
jgi:hypothetical protein